MEITDTVSVMRRGEMTATVRTADTSPAELAELMVGRKVLLQVDKTPSARPVTTVLSVERPADHAGRRGAAEGHRPSRSGAGEILGIAGVAGNGQSELLEVLGGMIAATGGRVTLFGEPIDIMGPGANGQTRRERGIGHVPEDRQPRA
jgi:general nucleoside transport system ATP-binding protein